MHSECKEEKTFCLFKLFATEAQRHRVNEVLMLWLRNSYASCERELMNGRISIIKFSFETTNLAKKHREIFITNTLLKYLCASVALWQSLV